MALSDADLDAAWTKARSKNGPQWVPYFEALRAVAALTLGKWFRLAAAIVAGSRMRAMFITGMGIT